MASGDENVTHIFCHLGVHGDLGDLDRVCGKGNYGGEVRGCLARPHVGHETLKGSPSFEYRAALLSFLGGEEFHPVT